MFITVGQFDRQLFALSFNAVADRQIVRIVDLQLLLVAVDSQNMVLVDCACLEFTGATGLVLQLFGDLENAMFRLFFHIQCRIVIQDPGYCRQGYASFDCDVF